MTITGLAAPTSESEQLTDEEIVRRVTEGEVPLFEILMRRHNQRVYRAVRGIIRDESEAEDVMQQAYLNAYRHLDGFAGRARFSTWLTKIAIHEALGRMRLRQTARQRGEQSADDEEMENVRSQSPDPEQQAVSADLRQLLEATIDSLPDSYRTVLMLREVNGDSTAEVAECLAVSEDVVKTRLHRARTMVRERLYDLAGVSSRNLYTFYDPRCDRVVARVFEALTGVDRVS